MSYLTRHLPIDSKASATLYGDLAFSLGEASIGFRQHTQVPKNTQVCWDSLDMAMIVFLMF